MKKYMIVAAACCLFSFAAGGSRAEEGDPKSPALAFALSFVLPAGGQYYDGDIAKGLIFDAGMGLGVAVAVIGAGNSAVFVRQEGNGPYLPDPNVTTTTIGVVAAVGFWIVSLIDAPGSADAYNRNYRSTQALGTSILEHWTTVAQRGTFLRRPSILNFNSWGASAGKPASGGKNYVWTYI